MKNRRYARLLLAVLVTLMTTISPLTAQEEDGYKNKEWKPLLEGKYNVKYAIQRGSKMIQFIVDSAGIKPTIVDGKVQIAPVIIFDMTTEKNISLKDNWVGDPINPIDVFEGKDSNVFYISDERRIYKALISHDSVVYTPIFQSKRPLRSTQHICEAGDHFLVIDNLYRDINVLSNGDYVFKKTIQFEKYILLDVVYTKTGRVLVGLGAPTLGSGIVELNLETGKDTAIPQKELSGNSMEPIQMTIMEDELYVVTDPSNEQYRSEGMLFKLEETTQTFIPIISGIVTLPLKDHTNTWYIHPWPKAIAYPSLDTLEGGTRYLFSKQGIGEMLYNYDIRKDIRFSEEFYTAFGQRHRYTAYCDYIIDHNNKTYGFGTHLISVLGNKSTSTSKQATISNSFGYYPNPATNSITIDNPSQEETNYVIRSATGQIILNELFTQNVIVDISTLQSGLYFISVGDSKSLKLIKK